MTRIAHHETCGICHTDGFCEHSKNRLIEELTKVSLARPTWDDVWMGLAESLAKRSTCSRLQVGCAVITEDNQQVLGIGYNGGPKGISNDCLSLEPGLCGHLHAEINALIKANYTSTVPKKLYVTTQPCYQCAVAIINADVAEVVYRKPYRITDGLELLGRAGIKVRKLGEEG